MHFAVEDVRDDIARATEGVRAGAIKIPLEPDRDRLEEALAEAGRDVAPLEVPIDIDDLAFSAELRRALEEGEVVARNPILFKLDGDAADLERKIAGAEDQLNRLRTEGVEIALRARSTELTAAIERSEARLNALASKEWTAEINVKISEEQLKLGELRAELEALDRETVEPEVRVQIAAALSRLAEYSAALNAVDGKRVTAIAEMDVDTLMADAQIAAFVARQRARHKIDIPIGIDRNQAAVALRGIGELISPVLSGLGDSLKGLFGELGKGGRSFVSGFQEGLGSLQGKLGQVGQVALQVALAIHKIELVGAALGFAGAGISAAWGAVATAIAAIPSALSLVGAAAGTVALGLDGIKKAAGAIKPELDKLKASVSATFEKNMTPAFEVLGRALPKVSDEINKVAQSLSSVAVNVAILLASSRGVQLLETVFQQVSLAIIDMQPGLLNIIDTFLVLAGQKGALDALVGTINTFGAAFRASVVDLVSGGQLQAAFAGLQGTLESLTRAFVQLVDNGIRLFATAAPGVNRFLDSLTGFFERFNWGALGTAVSGVFDGLARAINNVPQGVIDNISRGFAGMAQAVNAPGFQTGLQSIMDLIGQFVAALPHMIDTLGRTAVAFSGFVDVMVASFQTVGPGFDLMLAIIQGRGDLIGKALMDLAKAGVDAAPLMAQGMQKIAQAAEGGGPAIAAGVQAGIAPAGPAAQAAIASAFAPVKASIEAEFSKAGITAESSLHNIDAAIDRGTANWAATAQAGAAAVPPAVGQELGQVPPAAETALAPLQQLDALRGMRDQFTLAAADSMHAMSVGVQSGMAEVQQQFTAGLDAVTTNLNSSFTQKLALSVQSGMSLMAAQVTAGMPQIQAAFNFTGITTQIGAVFLGLVGSFSLGMASLANTVLAGMPQIQAAFNFTGITTQIGAVFLGLVGTVNLGMASLAAAVTANMVLVQQAFGTGLQGVTQSIQLAFGTAIPAAVAASFVQIQNAVVMGMIGVTNAVIDGGVSMQAAMHVAIGLMATDVSTQMQIVANAVDAGMQGITEVVNSNMSIAAAAMTVGMAGMAAAASAGMQGVTSAVLAGMATVVAAIDSAGRMITQAAQQSMTGFGTAIQAGMTTAQNTVRIAADDMVAQVRRLATEMSASINQAMAQFSQAITSGMVRAGGAVGAGVANMVRIVNTASGQMHAAGVAMMNGLRAGITSQAGAIAAAAAAVVRGAVAAARAEAQVRSPSRVFLQIGSYMGEGLALGMEASVPRVEQAATAMANAAVDSADRIQAAFAGDDWAAQFSSKVEHSFTELDGAMSQRDVVGQQRVTNGELTQSTALLAAILTVLRAIQNGKGVEPVGVGTAVSRQRAELGAF